MKLYKRTGSMFDWSVDRHVNVPGNAEHTQAAFKELHGLYLQGLSQGGFRRILLETLPAYPINGSEADLAQWEDNLSAWEKTLSQDEHHRLRFDVRVSWESVSDDPETDKLRSQAKYRTQCDTLDRLGLRPQSGFFGKL